MTRDLTRMPRYPKPHIVHCQSGWFICYSNPRFHRTRYLTDFYPSISEAWDSLPRTEIYCGQQYLVDKKRTLAQQFIPIAFNSEGVYTLDSWTKASQSVSDFKCRFVWETETYYFDFIDDSSFALIKKDGEWRMKDPPERG